MVNKKAVLIATVIAIVVVIIAVIIGVNALDDLDYSFETVETNEVQEENTTEENTIEEETDSSEENVVEENTTEETNTTESNEVVEETSIDDSTESDEDIAKNLAEEKWGEDDSVYYYVEEELSDGVYLVSVRSQETTETLEEYEVNVETEEVSEY